MSAVVFIRNCVAAALAMALLWFGAQALTPVVSPHLPNPEALLAVLGLACVLAPIVYKLLVDLLAAVRVGGASPARSMFVSIIAGGSVVALVSAAGLFVLGHGLEQAAEIAKGAPAAQALVRTGVLHLNMLTLGAAFVAALFVGSWAGRRHGVNATVAVVGFALLGWAMMLGIDILAGAKSVAEVREGLHAVTGSIGKGFSGFLAAARVMDLPLLLGALIFGLVGVSASGGKTGSAAPRALVLGAAT